METDHFDVLDGLLGDDVAWEAVGLGNDPEKLVTAGIKGTQLPQAQNNQQHTWTATGPATSDTNSDSFDWDLLCALDSQPPSPGPSLCLSPRTKDDCPGSLSGPSDYPHEPAPLLQAHPQTSRSGGVESLPEQQHHQHHHTTDTTWPGRCNPATSRTPPAPAGTSSSASAEAARRQPSPLACQAVSFTGAARGCNTALPAPPASSLPASAAAAATPRWADDVSSRTPPWTSASTAAPTPEDGAADRAGAAAVAPPEAAAVPSQAGHGTCVAAGGPTSGAPAAAPPVLVSQCSACSAGGAAAGMAGVSSDGGSATESAVPASHPEYHQQGHHLHFTQEQLQQHAHVGQQPQALLPGSASTSCPVPPEAGVPSLTQDGAPPKPDEEPQQQPQLPPAPPPFLGLSGASARQLTRAAAAVAAAAALGLPPPDLAAMGLLPTPAAATSGGAAGGALPTSVTRAVSAMAPAPAPAPTSAAMAPAAAVARTRSPSADRGPLPLPAPPRRPTRRRATGGCGTPRGANRAATTAAADVADRAMRSATRASETPRGGCCPAFEGCGCGCGGGAETSGREAAAAGLGFDDPAAGLHCAARRYHPYARRRAAVDERAAATAGPAAASGAASAPVGPGADAGLGPLRLLPLESGPLTGWTHATADSREREQEVVAAGGPRAPSDGFGHGAYLSRDEAGAAAAGLGGVADAAGVVAGGGCGCGATDSYDEDLSEVLSYHLAELDGVCGMDEDEDVQPGLWAQQPAEPEQQQQQQPGQLQLPPGPDGPSPMAEDAELPTRMSRTGGGLGLGGGVGGGASCPDAACGCEVDDNEAEMELLREILCARTSGGGGGDNAAWGWTASPQPQPQAQLQPALTVAGSPPRPDSMAPGAAFAAAAAMMASPEPPLRPLGFSAGEGGDTLPPALSAAVGDIEAAAGAAVDAATAAAPGSAASGVGSSNGRGLCSEQGPPALAGGGGGATPAFSSTTSEYGGAASGDGFAARRDSSPHRQPQQRSPVGVRMGPTACSGGSAAACGGGGGTSTMAPGTASPWAQVPPRASETRVPPPSSTPPAYPPAAGHPTAPPPCSCPDCCAYGSGPPAPFGTQPAVTAGAPWQPQSYYAPHLSSPPPANRAPQPHHRTAAPPPYTSGPPAPPSTTAAPPPPPQPGFGFGFSPRCTLPCCNPIASPPPAPCQLPCCNPHLRPAAARPAPREACSNWSRAQAALAASAATGGAHRGASSTFPNPSSFGPPSGSQHGSSHLAPAALSSRGAAPPTCSGGAAGAFPHADRLPGPPLGSPHHHHHQQQQQHHHHPSTAPLAMARPHYASQPFPEPHPGHQGHAGGGTAAHAARYSMHPHCPPHPYVPQPHPSASASASQSPYSAARAHHEQPHCPPPPPPPFAAHAPSHPHPAGIPSHGYCRAHAAGTPGHGTPATAPPLMTRGSATSGNALAGPPSGGPMPRPYPDSGAHRHFQRETPPANCQRFGRAAHLQAPFEHPPHHLLPTSPPSSGFPPYVLARQSTTATADVRAMAHEVSSGRAFSASGDGTPTRHYVSSERSRDWANEQT